MSTTILREERPTIPAAGDVGTPCPEELLARYTEILDHRLPIERKAEA